MKFFDMGFASDLPYNSYTILNYYINCEIYKGSDNGSGRDH